jgi:tyrosyl-DNA phosphodiesterase 2
MILMLQEMSDESLDAILAHPWVRENFIVSEKIPLPQMYFTLLLVDRRLVTGNWFRIDYPETEYGRDVLGVDILVAFGDDETAENGRPARRLRFLTTHLESLAEEAGYELRPKQLALASSLLKEKSVARHGYEIVGGVVGGDMNAISEVDEGIHRRDDVGLRDVWEENGQDHGPTNIDGADGGQGEKDDTFGRAEGHTWGYQSRGKWPPRRFDKFFYTGALDMVELEETKDASGKVGRLGVSLKTQEDLWVSDHFGIAVGVKVL